MELTLTGTPLDELQDAFLDLTTRLEAKAIDLDAALRELQTRQVVDASGHIWRIDPVSRSFVRRAPGPNASWLPATPADFLAAGRAGAEPATAAPGGAGQIADAGWVAGPAGVARVGDAKPVARQSRVPAAVWTRTRALVPVPRAVAGRFRSISWRWYAAGGVAVVAVAVIVTATSGSSSKAPAKVPVTARTITATPSAPAGVVGKGFPVPDTRTYNDVITEISSGDPARIAKVADNGPYGPADRRLFAATYAGWSDRGLTIRPELPVGAASGLTATQVWELRDHGTALGVASVTWTRASRSAPWRLATWPAFRAPS